jgi:protein tyrosine/serine phosphatase
VKSITTLLRHSFVLLVAAGLPLAATASTTTVSGVGNFEKVSDHVYRGAQPTDEGFRSLAKLGIATVIDLQPYGDARSLAEEKAVKADGMQYVNLGMHGMETPSDATVAKVLAILESTQGGPVFVHCHRGADRTGGVIACYRIEHDHWDNTKALKEARAMGMSWYQTAIQHYVLKYQPKSAGSAAPEIATVAAPSAASPAGITPPLASVSVIQ